MVNVLSNINWIEKNQSTNDIFQPECTLTLHPMNQGFEAEVMKISSDKESFVLKVWNKSSKPDIRFQFRLLNVLFERGISVSKPIGWGINSSGDHVLLTDFGGTPLLKLNVNKITEIAKILSSIHKINVADIGNIQLPKYDFIDYFFPGVIEHDDIFNVLSSLVQQTPIKQECIIHGDFHLHNILEGNDQYTVIDWTNGQLGDPRYDFAWSLILKKIYISNRIANVFCSAYLLENNFQQEELEVFEALALLRWILLNKSGGVPRETKAIEKVKRLIKNNRFLSNLRFKELQ